MSEKLAQHFDDLPYLLGGHLLLSISAVLVGVIDCGYGDACRNLGVR